MTSEGGSMLDADQQVMGLTDNGADRRLCETSRDAGFDPAKLFNIKIN